MRGLRGTGPSAAAARALGITLAHLRARVLCASMVWAGMLCAGMLWAGMLWVGMLWASGSRAAQAPAAAGVAAGMPAAGIAASAAHRGGDMVLATHTACGSIDPHVNYTECYYQIFNFIADGLVGFSKQGGEHSFDIVPDLAETLPEISDDGRTYVFHLRPGIQFSDGRAVTVADVAASLRRIFKVVGPNSDAWFSNIIGGAECVAHAAACSLSGGVETDDASRRITIHLHKANPEFLYQLALPLTAILPADTAPHDLGLTPPITTGPYRVLSYRPEAELRLGRNPYFHVWNSLAQPDGYADTITLRFGMREEAEINAVLAGIIDWMFDPVPLDRLPELGARYARQLHIGLTAGLYFVPLNTRLPPFNVPAARQAVAYAISRRAIINLFGGAALGTPLCQLLPRGVPGWHEYCPFNTPAGPVWQGSDLARAQALVRASGTAGQSVTIVTRDTAVDRSIGLYLQSLLTDLGYRAATRPVSENVFGGYVQNTRNNVQMSVNYWYPDYALPADYLYLKLACASFHPGKEISLNFAGYCDPAMDRAMQAAMTLWGSDRAAATQAWQRIDEQLTDTAAEIPLFQINVLDLSSARLGNYVYSQAYGRLLGQAWLR